MSHPFGSGFSPAVPVVDAEFEEIPTASPIVDNVPAPEIIPYVTLSDDMITVAAADGGMQLASIYAAARMASLNLCSSDDLCGILGVGEATLTNWRRNNQGPKFFYIGKRVFYRLSDVHLFLQQYEPIGGGAKVDGAKSAGIKTGRKSKATNAPPSDQPDATAEATIIPPGVPANVADGTVPSEDPVTGAEAGIFLSGIRAGETILTDDPRLHQTLGDAIGTGTITLGEGAAAAFAAYMQEETEETPTPTGNDMLGVILPDVDAIEFPDEEEDQTSTFESPA